MYAALWRLLPGPLWVRILLTVGMVALVLTALVMWVFPWANTFISPEEVTIEQ